MEIPNLNNQSTQYLGQEGEDPSAPFWASGNYVGPYWSDGKMQESVEWGVKTPINELDELARQHDAAYARFKDDRHRAAADAIFAEEARKLKKKYGPKLAEDPAFAAAVVEYGNYAKRQGAKLAPSFILGPAGVFGAAKFVYDNIGDYGKMIKGTYLKSEKENVRKFFLTDPRLKTGGNAKASEQTGNEVRRPASTTKSRLGGREKVTKAIQSVNKTIAKVLASNKVSVADQEAKRQARIKRQIEGAAAGLYHHADVLHASQLSEIQKQNGTYVPPKPRKQNMQLVHTMSQRMRKRKKKNRVHIN